jgi:hypothetical protein
VRRLGNAIAAILDGRATVPDVDIPTLERVWPILVTANVTLSEVLYDTVEAALPPIFADGRVQTLLILDPEDLEYLMGMVEAGTSLTAILQAREESPCRKLEFARWANESRGSPGRDSRPGFAVERWERLMTAVVELLNVEDELHAPMA